MAEPRLLQVGNEETTAKEKGESGLSSAQVGTEAKTVEKASEEPKGVYVANENVVNDNSKALRTSQEAPKGQYVAPTERLGGFERSAGEKGVVNTITVDEVKALIKQYGGGSGDTYTKEEIDHIVETMRKGLYQEVDTTEYPTLEDFLDSDGEEGIIYLYPVGNEGNNYYQYIWETTKEWISLGTTVIDLSQYAKLTLLAPIYDSTATYSVGAKCVYNGKLYTCSTAITQAEDFNSSHWTEISVSSGFVDFDSAQTITGVKTFAEKQVIPSINVPSLFAIFVGNQEKYRMDDASLRPWGITGTIDLGNSAHQWKDGYFAGQVYADNVINVINASDISSNTLTQAQFDLINNGKKTIIKGTFLGYDDLEILTCSSSGTIRRGLLVGKLNSNNRYVDFINYQINSSLVMSLDSQKTQLRFDIQAGNITIETNNYISLNSIYAAFVLDGKNFPKYPTTNTSPQVLTIGENGGNLTWGDEWNPTSVSLSDGGTISDTTLQANIQYHRPIVLNGFTRYFSCDDGTNYQYTSMRYDANANKNHFNVITINKSTWVATFHTSDLTLD